MKTHHFVSQVFTFNTAHVKARGTFWPICVLKRWAGLGGWKPLQTGMWHCCLRFITLPPKCGLGYEIQLDWVMYSFSLKTKFSTTGHCLNKQADSMLNIFFVNERNCSRSSERAQTEYICAVKSKTGSTKQVMLIAARQTISTIWKIYMNALKRDMCCAFEDLPLTLSHYYPKTFMLIVHYEIISWIIYEQHKKGLW